MKPNSLIYTCAASLRITTTLRDASGNTDTQHHVYNEIYFLHVFSLWWQQQSFHLYNPPHHTHVHTHSSRCTSETHKSLQNMSCLTFRGLRQALRVSLFRTNRLPAVRKQAPIFAHGWTPAFLLSAFSLLTSRSQSHLYSCIPILVVLLFPAPFLTCRRGKKGPASFRSFQMQSAIILSWILSCISCCLFEKDIP